MRDAQPADRATSPLAKARVIDFHAHVLVPEVVEFAKGHGVETSVPPDPRITEEAREASRRWRTAMLRKMTELPDRLVDMDATGVDVQVLSASTVSMDTTWAPPGEALAMEQLANDRIAQMVAFAPDRFTGLGGVPLQSPQASVRELERCVRSLGLRGVQVSTRYGDMELGDSRLRPFWEAAQALDAVVYIHPAGITEPRFRPFQYWNSIGQPLEEAMAMASLMHEGVLDAFPRLKLVIGHGGGYLPYYIGRLDRNYAEKPFTRANMSMSPSQYLKTRFWYDSCVYDSDALAVLFRKVGASRILLGSDYPVGDADPVGFLTAVTGDPDEQADMLGRNAAALLGIH
ncbi:MAG: amidohydrolase family protein [Ramlibacter sp.]|uniref:amidohydrolase family protein n=1 Tax=Ramlibacter sp. TaxID=1917967 RepID=UPI00262CAAF2|nr:amidohydrolase family protein [Ramlibacter sp.]MDH4378141.1 amidohydrolase family protein [Ramlibacter sp.]